MLKKCAVLGLMLLLVGGLALAWVRAQVREEQREANAHALQHSAGPEEYLDKYSRWHELTPQQRNQLVLELDKDQKEKPREELANEQQARLRRDLARLAAGERVASDIADFLYGPNWEEKVTQYTKQKEQEQIAQTASAVCLSLGGTLFTGCLLIWIVESLNRGLRTRSRRRQQSDDPETQEAELTDIPHEEPMPEQPPIESPPRRRRKLCTELSELSSSSDAEDADLGGTASSWPNGDMPFEHAAPAARTSPVESAVALLLSDEPAPDEGWSPETQWAAQGPQDDVSICLPQSQPSVAHAKATVPEAEEASDETDNTLKEQADDLQKQIAEFREVAESVQQAKRDHTEPINSTLKELAQQVSAIREYAACQQNRVEKLQDGYDWTIIRTFCLRVIRCIDNIENRVDNLTDGNGSVTPLEEVRDELLFALESSGVEQFRPEIRSGFRGQEKFAEAIKEKEPAETPEQPGTIAKVIRPGYRYIVDDDSYKVVRTAQVKLYG